MRGMTSSTTCTDAVVRTLAYDDVPSHPCPSPPRLRLRSRAAGARARARRTRWRSGRPGRAARARPEALPVGVARRERRGRLEVALAPVRAPVVLVADRLDRAEERLPRPSRGSRAPRCRRSRGRPPGSGTRRRRATKRTSNGKPTARRPALHDVAHRAQRGTPRAGSAYSISVNRTRRGLAKIRSQRSTRVALPAARATARLMRGIACGTRAPHAAREAERAVGEQRRPRRQRRAAATAAAAARRRACSCASARRRCRGT